MIKIFLAPRSNETSYEHFESTILGGRNFSEIEPYLSEKEKAVLKRADSFPKISVWGNKETLKSRWEKMEPGDVVLFYAQGAFYYSSNVVLTKFSPELAKILWPLDKEDGKPWSCLFFVDHLKEINIPIEVVRELAEYDPDWDRVMGFMPLRESGVRAIEQKFGTIDAFLGQRPEVYAAIDTVIASRDDEVLQEEMPEVTEVNKEKLREAAVAYKNVGEGYEVKQSPHKVRKENREQKRRVAILEDYTCQLCGWFLEWVKNGKKVRRIDIDHIIEKRDGGTEEIGNLWALCPNCHVKKTVGVIIIDPIEHKITEMGKVIPLMRDNHLGW